MIYDCNVIGWDRIVYLSIPPCNSIEYLYDLSECKRCMYDIHVYAYGVQSEGC
jgi:hypothetical protein